LKRATVEAFDVEFGRLLPDPGATFDGECADRRNTFMKQSHLAGQGDDDETQDTNENPEKQIRNHERIHHEILSG